MKMKINEIFDIISNYTNLNIILNVSKQFKEYKKQYYIYNFNKEISLLYYNDINFKNKINSSVLYSNKQIKLNLYQCQIITDVSVLDNVHTLNLYGCKNIIDVSTLGNVNTLNLSYCNKITDISALGNVHTLNLSCTNIIDVSALGNVYTLNLNHILYLT